jgi:hypothetical protein
MAVSLDLPEKRSGPIFIIHGCTLSLRDAKSGRWKTEIELIKT